MATTGQFNNYAFPPQSHTASASNFESAASQSREASFFQTETRPLTPKKSNLRPSPLASPLASPGLVPDEESAFKTRDKVRRTFAGTAFKALVEGENTTQRQIFKPDPLDCFIEEKTIVNSNTQSFPVIDSPSNTDSSTIEFFEPTTPEPHISTKSNILLETKEEEIISFENIQEPTKPSSIHKGRSPPSRKPSDCNSALSDDVSVVVLQRGKSLKSKKFQFENTSHPRHSLRDKEFVPYLPSSLNPRNNKSNSVAPEPPVAPEPQKYFIKKRITPTSSSHINSASEDSEILELQSKKEPYSNNPSFPQNTYQPSLPGSGSYHFSSLTSYSNFEKDALIRAHHTNSGSDPFSFQTKHDPSIQEQSNSCTCIIL